jgi:hypothetical protein
MKMNGILSDMTGKAISSVFRTSDNEFLTTSWDGTVYRWEVQESEAKEFQAMPVDWFSEATIDSTLKLENTIQPLQLIRKERLFHYSNFNLT